MLQGTKSGLRFLYITLASRGFSSLVAWPAPLSRHQASVEQLNRSVAFSLLYPLSRLDKKSSKFCLDKSTVTSVHQIANLSVLSPRPPTELIDRKFSPPPCFVPSPSYASLPTTSLHRSAGPNRSFPWLARRHPRAQDTRLVSLHSR